jgi:hypothetical protein
MGDEDHTEDPLVDGRIIFEWIIGKQGGKLWTGSIWLRIGACEHRNFRVI